MPRSKLLHLLSRSDSSCEKRPKRRTALLGHGNGPGRDDPRLHDGVPVAGRAQRLRLSLNRLGTRASRRAAAGASVSYLASNSARDS
jgi:hypothetical protein